MNLVDVLILGFILFGALRGYQRGLLTSIVNFISSIAGFIIASLEYRAFLNWIEIYFPLQKWLEPLIYKTLLPAVQSQASSMEHQVLGNILGSLPPEWRNLLTSSNLPNVQITQSMEQAAQSLSGILTDRILSLISFGVVFFLVVLVIKVLFTMVLHNFDNWGWSFNRGGGLLFGGLCALIALSVLAGIISPLLKIGVGGSLNTLIQQSFFYPFLMNIFSSLDHMFSAQLSQKLFEPLSLGKGILF